MAMIDDSKVNEWADRLDKINQELDGWDIPDGVLVSSKDLEKEIRWEGERFEWAKASR